tara:strand:+ start:5487 stop:6179 length:693 start_codon:yes stop_codon:yes gene_type:complete
MKNILLIGGSTGIGYELSQKLKQDYNVFISTRDQDKFNDQNIITQELNLDQEFETDWLPEQIDGFVYLPGTINLRPFKGLKPSVFLEDFNINVMGCVKILQKVLSRIQAAENPSIVMFSTVAVKIGMPFHSSVSSSKGAIEGLTRSLAAEFAPNIRVNSIAPSILETPMSEKFLNSEAKLDNAKNRHPLKEIGSAKEISEIVKFLLEDNSKWMTGQIISVDGGMSSLRTN